MGSVSRNIATIGSSSCDSTVGASGSSRGDEAARSEDVTCGDSRDERTATACSPVSGSRDDGNNTEGNIGSTSQKAIGRTPVEADSVEIDAEKVIVIGRRSGKVRSKHVIPVAKLDVENDDD